MIPSARGSRDCRVVVLRGGVEESVHRVHAVVVDAHGSTLRKWGDPGHLTLLRSAAKPMQALPLVEDGVTEAFGLTDEELALCCASHNSEERHIEAARRILAKSGLSEDHLACGPHTPLLPGRKSEILASGRDLTSIMSNCSGKHAGMLALAVHHGWSVRGYQRPDHPVQRRMVTEMVRWSGASEGELRLEVDGCGVPCFALPLERAAGAAARFAAAAGRGEPAARVVKAMIGYPFMVAGTSRLCTALMEATPSLFAKVGAEGVYVAGSPERGWGVALKVEDGAWRGAPPALLSVLREVDLLDDEDLATLTSFHSPPVLNTVGDRVGRLAVRL